MQNPKMHGTFLLYCDLKVNNKMIEPRNEQGVVVAFSQLADKYGYRIVDIQTPYPDAVIYSHELGKEIRAEFEHYARSFVNHGHDPSQCDLLIC